jgi:hypothetical protein
MTSTSKALAAVVTALALAAPASAGDISLFGAYWDTDAAGDAAGGGIGIGFPFNETLALELRATYFEELEDDPLENAFDSDDPVFQEAGIQATPIDVGLRINFGPADSGFRPYIAGGGSYFLLDSDFGEISDEVGYYAALGAEIGDGEGAQFFVEGLWRKATAEIELDPDDLDDIDDLEVQDHASFDVDGLGLNLGARWKW